jgi:hypothetical protein
MTPDIPRPINYTKLAETLREELRPVFQNAVRRSFRPAEADVDVGCVYPLDDDEIIYTQFYGPQPYVARYNLKTGSFIWKVTGYTYPFGIDYDQVDDIVAVAHNSGITLLRGSDGSLVKNITSVGTYTLPRIYDAVFNPSNPDELYFTVPGQHVLVKLNHVTGEYTMFGTWGTYKTDYTGLYNPSDVEVDPPNDDVFVCDMSNHRILRLNMAINTVKDLMLLPRPAFIRKMRWGLTTQRYLLTVISSELGGFGPMYTFGYLRGRRLKFILPMQADHPRFTPDLCKMWVAEVEGLELDLDRLNEMYIYHPEQFIILNQASVSTAGYTSPPITPFILGKNVQIMLISNQTGTLTIQVPNMVSTSFSMGLLPMSVPTTFTWVNYDSVSTPSGVYKYNFSIASNIPPPVFRIVYTPSATATVSLFVYFNP